MRCYVYHNRKLVKICKKCYLLKIACFNNFKIVCNSNYVESELSDLFCKISLVKVHLIDLSPMRCYVYHNRKLVKICKKCYLLKIACFNNFKIVCNSNYVESELSDLFCQISLVKVHVIDLSPMRYNRKLVKLCIIHTVEYVTMCHLRKIVCQIRFNSHMYGSKYSNVY